MTRTIRRNGEYSRSWRTQWVGRFALEAHERAEQDQAFAAYVGFYDPPQQIVEPEDIACAHARKVPEGRQ